MFRLFKIGSIVPPKRKKIKKQENAPRMNVMLSTFFARIRLRIRAKKIIVVVGEIIIEIAAITAKLIDAVNAFFLLNKLSSNAASIYFNKKPARKYIVIKKVQVIISFE